MCVTLIISIHIVDIRSRIRNVIIIHKNTNFIIQKWKMNNASDKMGIIIIFLISLHVYKYDREQRLLTKKDKSNKNT